VPCSRGTARAQINRLGQLPYFSQMTDEAMTSLVDTLMEQAESAEHATAAITLWLQGCRSHDARLPTDGDLLALLASTSPSAGQRSDAPPKKGYCGRCDRGWIHREITRNGRKYSASGKCTCQPGGWVSPAPAPQLQLAPAEE